MNYVRQRNAKGITKAQVYLRDELLGLLHDLMSAHGLSLSILINSAIEIAVRNTEDQIVRDALSVKQSVCQRRD